MKKLFSQLSNLDIDCSSIMKLKAKIKKSRDKKWFLRDLHINLITLAMYSAKGRQIHNDYVACLVLSWKYLLDLLTHFMIDKKVKKIGKHHNYLCTFNLLLEILRIWSYSIWLWFEWNEMRTMLVTSLFVSS